MRNLKNIIQRCETFAEDSLPLARKLLFLGDNVLEGKV